MDILEEAAVFEPGLPSRFPDCGDRPDLLDGATATASRVAAGNSLAPDAARTRPKLPPEIVAVATALIDFLLVLMTAASIFAIYFRMTQRSPSQTSLYWVTAILAATALVGIFERFGGYRSRRLQAFSWQVSHLALAWAMAVSFLLIIAFAGRITGDYSRGWTFAWFLATPLMLLTGRCLVHRVAARCFRDGSLACHIVIVGAGDDGRKVVSKLLNHRDGSVVVGGIFDDRIGQLPRFIQGVPVLGTTDDLLRYARRQSVDQIIVALPLEADAQLKAIFEKLTVIPADLRLSVDPLAERFSVLGISRLADIPLLEIVSRPLKRGDALYKWLEDKIISSVVLVIMGPLFAIIAMLIKCDSRGSVFFVQERFGLNNNVIRVLKFRTMYAHSEDPSGARRTVQNDPRVTRVGRFLRSLSLDELPQLINVMRGEMSLVGPRPHAIAMRAGDRLYHEAVSRYPQRHRVKPGLTGWAQVNGFRGEVDTLEKARGRVECDLYYIANWSPWLDLKIMLKTLGLLISGADAY
jgi:Undecaprenyl-phosphate glucose phosphotransferase